MGSGCTGTKVWADDEAAVVEFEPDVLQRFEEGRKWRSCLAPPLEAEHNAVEIQKEPKKHKQELVTLAFSI